GAPSSTYRPRLTTLVIPVFHYSAGSFQVQVPTPQTTLWLNPASNYSCMFFPRFPLFLNFRTRCSSP
ncbi:hypothetical protein L873DRAFT_1812464, partial [Choiromyces venosus 120613-1]